MASILEALEMAQKRNKERDAMKAQSGMPVLPVTQTGFMQTPAMTMGNDQPELVDTRTPHQMYLDAIDTNQWVGAVPVLGTIAGAMNDAYIDKYERENPDMVTGGGLNKYSMLGRAMGRGLTTEERLQAEQAGLGLGALFGGETNEAGVRPASYSLLDRVTGNVPINWATQGDYIGSFPEGSTSGSEGFETSGGGSDNTYNFGGRESMIDEQDYSGYA